MFRTFYFRPGVSNLVLLHSLATGKPLSTVLQEAESESTGSFKLLVGESVSNHLRPIREEAERLLSQEGLLEDILMEGTSRAQAIASQTWRELCDVATLVSGRRRNRGKGLVL